MTSRLDHSVEQGETDEYELTSIQNSGPAHTDPPSLDAAAKAGVGLPKSRTADGLELEFDIEDNSPQGDAPRPFFSAGVKLFLLATLCGSVMKTISKYLVEEMSPALLILTRMTITGIVSLVVMWWRKVPHFFWGPPGIRIMLFIRGWLGFLNICMTYYALQYLTLPDAAVLSYLNPLATCVAARLFLHEQYQLQQALASLISLLGVLIIAHPSWLFGTMSLGNPDSSEVTPEQRQLAIGAVLVNVVGSSAVMIILRYIGRRCHPLAPVSNYAFMSILGSGLWLAGTSKDSLLLPQRWQTWGLICVMGFFGFMLQFLTAKAIQIEEATVLSNLKYTQLVFAIFFEWLIWHDLPGMWSIAGMLLILLGVVCSARYKLPKPTATTTAV